MGASWPSGATRRADGAASSSGPAALLIQLRGRQEGAPHALAEEGEEQARHTARHRERALRHGRREVDAARRRGGGQALLYIKITIAVARGH